MDNQKGTNYIVDAPVGVIILNNEPGNFLQDPEFISLGELKEFIEKNELKGLIITGKGRHFSSGADLPKLFANMEGEDHFERQISKGHELLNFIEELEIPTASAIEGICFGGGLEISLATHLRICSEKALFAFPEVNHNLMPGLGGTQRLTRLLKGGLSYEIILRGDMMSADKAVELGIVDHIVHGETPLDYTVKLLKKMTIDRPRHVIHAVIRSINNFRTLKFEDALLEETRLFCELVIKEAKRKKKEEE